MKEINYKQFEEILYTKTLPNGLKVNLLPRKYFQKVYGVFTTNYGSIDTSFSLNNENKIKHFPAGIAHFLEHKLFEKEKYDALYLFGKYGAEANAYTSFTRTSYLFSGTSNINKCVEILLDFVQEPYFSEKTVQKEKGIIAQEIKMYDDNPSWRLYFGILKNLYPKSPISVDIAGDVSSIEKITKRDLYECYNAFYQPSNMNLFIVGGLDPIAMIETIEKNQAQKNFLEQFKIEREKIVKNPVIAKKVIKMDVKREKVAIGIRGLKDFKDGAERLSYKIKLDLLFYLLYSESSKEYLRLYQKGIFNDSLNYNVQMERGFYYATVSCDTDESDLLEDAILSILRRAKNILENNEDDFKLAQKEFIGQYLQAMNSIEAIANQYENDLFSGKTIFDIVPIIEKLKPTDVLTVAEEFINENMMSVYKIVPQNKK